MNHPKRFPKDNNTYGIDKQFLIGPAFLVSPVIEELKEDVDAYFPKNNWFRYYDGYLETNEGQETIKLNAQLDFIPLHIRGGYIMPTQKSANTTHYARQNEFGLIVAPNNDNEAYGDLFYDDGQTQDFDANHFFATFALRDNKLKMNIEHNSYSEMSKLTLDKIRIFTKPNKNLKFVANKQIVLTSSQVRFNQNEIILTGLRLPMYEGFEIEWTTDINSVLDIGNHQQSSTIIECPVNGVNKESCLQKGCVYNENVEGTPACFIPKEKGGYFIENFDSTGTYTLTKSDSFSLFGDDISELKIKVSHGAIGNDNKFKLTNIKVKLIQI